MNVRRADLSDLGAVQRINADAYTQAYQTICGFVPKPAFEDYRPRIDRGEVWILERDGQPIGIAVHPGTGQVVVADSNASQISLFNISSPGTPAAVTVDVGPNAPAIDPTRNITAVAEGGSDKVVIVDLATNQILGRISGTALPTGAMYDPDSDRFLVTSSTTNNVYSFHVDPSTGTYSAPVGYAVGFNPTSLDYNYRTSTLVTGNAMSQTLSVLDFLSGKVKAVIPLSLSQQFAVAIDPKTNRAVVVDQNNNRVLILPLPR